MPLAFFSQRVVAAALLGDPLDEAFRGVRVEVVDDENPFGRRVEIHGSFEVRDELGFGAGRL